MPYDIERQGSQWCVRKRGGDVHGCHPSRAAAIRQQRALYAAEARSSSSADTTVSEMSDTVAEEEVRGPAWRGVLAVEGQPTADKRLLIPGEITERDLPVPLNVQLQTGDGHEDSFNAGRIDAIEHVPLADVSEDDVNEFGLEDLPESAIVIWGQGTFDTSEYADEAQRMLSNGSGVSVDLSRERVALFDPETMEEVDDSDLSLEEKLFGDYLQGIGGKIGGATVVTIPAFEEASIKVVDDGVLVASAFGIRYDRPYALTAAAGPVKPPSAWFQNPKLKELTPLTITKEGRVFGHLADWDGCHIGFQGVCVPPFRSNSDYSYFNTGELETAEGELVPCGKIMFSRSGVGHASDDPSVGYQEAQRHYDDATKVGAFVRAGTDRFGTWLAGSLRSDLTDLEVQHMRSHPPSGDWRSIGPHGPVELIAAFSVPIGGFPIRRSLVASADDEISAIITAPLVINHDVGARSRRRARVLLSRRLEEVLGPKEESRAAMRERALNK